MAFDPLYGAHPGRPLPRIRAIGQSLSPFNPAVENAMGGMEMPPNANTPTSDSTLQRVGQSLRSDRVGAAASSVAASLDPSSPYGPEAFVGGLARGFAGVQDYLRSVTGQRTAMQEHTQDRALNTRKVEQGIKTDAAQAEYYRAGAQERTAPADPIIPEWQHKGFPSFKAWQEEGRWLDTHGQPRSPGITPAAERETAIQHRALELMRGNDYNRPLNARDARTQAEQDIDAVMPGVSVTPPVAPTAPMATQPSDTGGRVPRSTTPTSGGKVSKADYDRLIQNGYTRAEILKDYPGGVE